MTKKANKPLRFAVVGLGHIAQTAVLPAFKNAKNKAVLSAFVSGDPLKLKTFGRQYKIENLYSYSEYEECLQSGLIDAVFIALPNHLHCDYAVQALEMGIHVLCEKPLALTEEECQRMIKASEKSGAKLMTAYRLHFEEANLKAAQIARKQLGQLRLFTSTFTQQVKDRGNIRLKKSDGGSPIWDIGIYCINAARSIFRTEPTEVFATSASNSDPRFKEADEMTSVMMRFPDDCIATFICSYGAALSNSYDIVGTKGSLHMAAAYDYGSTTEMTLKIGDKTTKKSFKKVDQFAAELVYFSDCVRTGKSIEPSGLEGLADVRIIAGAIESVRTGRTVKLKTISSSLVRKKHPKTTQMFRKPPLKRVPKPLHAHPASS